MAKQRLDMLLVERGLAGSRERAKRMIMAGEVLVDNQKVDKAGATVKAEAEIRLLGSDIPYVSRGGLKLAKAMKEFGVEITGKRCADIGASTGGFTDCMLQNGAVQVFAIDVGYGQLAWKLRTDERVVNMERTNIRNVTLEDIGTALDFASIDVAFISLTKVLPVTHTLLTDKGEVVALIPQGNFLCPRNGLCDYGFDLFSRKGAGRQYRISYPPVQGHGTGRYGNGG